MEQTLGKRIMTNRKRLGMTQDQLAEKLGVTAQAVSKWENDQSCPDISMLPQLAEIFGTTVDALLGRTVEEVVHEAEVIPGDTAIHENSDEDRKHNWHLSFESRRKDAIAPAVLVLLVGVLLLLKELFQWSSVSFWDILWPSALLVFGLFGIYPNFSFFRLGCLLFGGYFLLDNLNLFQLELSSGFILPLLLILFGLSLFADALKRPQKPRIHFHKTKDPDSDFQMQYNTADDSFDYSASFGSCAQSVVLERLASGKISTSFGDYTIDLRGVESVADGCRLEAECSFGELQLLVPGRFTVLPHSNASFADVSVSGQPDEEAQGSIFIDASASFGQIVIQYV